MKTYIIKEKKFRFQEKDSFDIPLMGMTSLEMLLREFPQAECISDEDFDLKRFDVGEGALLIKSSYPLFNREMAAEVLDAFESEKCVIKFMAGLVVPHGHSGAMDSVEVPCGAPLDSLSAYPVVLDEVRKAILSRHMKAGVLIENPADTYIAAGVRIEEGVVIRHDCHIEGNTLIKSGAVIQPYCHIKDSVIGHRVSVLASTLDGAEVGDGTTVGPNAYLRPQSVIGKDCRIGDFVEIKNAKIGDGTKVSHLSYVGDADVGERVNVGCGVVFVNYDGRNKHRSVVGNECFLGSNCNLIAPVVLEDNSFVAAGTTLTKDLKTGDFCIGRCREIIKQDRSFDYFGERKV